MVGIPHACVCARARKVFQEMWRQSGAKTAAEIVSEQDLGLVSDAQRLRDVCAKVVDSHPHEVGSRRVNFLNSPSKC